jgi:7,8-dihydroneopterin aldolase/epimerase/oxygenase
MSDSDTGLPPDRVFVRGYMRELEIGAYADERGRTQRVRFDISLEVGREGLPVGDNYTRVVNYEDLVEAIETLARGPRMNLVETFAERLAELCLVDPRARRVHIRLEKLDRLPGDAAYGIEIVRDRGAVSRERAWQRGSPG